MSIKVQLDHRPGGVLCPRCKRFWSGTGRHDDLCHVCIMRSDYGDDLLGSVAMRIDRELEK